MFIRKRPVAGKPSHTDVKVCENRREDGKVKQKVLKHIGRACNEDGLKTLVMAAQVFIDQEQKKRNGNNSLFDYTPNEENADISKPEKTQYNVDLSAVEEEKRIIEGPRDIFGYEYDKTNFDEVFDKDEDKELVKELVIARVSDPSSKRKTQQDLEKYCGFSCSLDKIYHLLTKLGSKADLVNKKAFEHSRTLFEDHIDVLFFDVTTIYFESWTEDDLKGFGFSKDNKFGQVQITLALASNSEGFPIGYKLFPGNKAETTTLIDCVKEWQKFISIDKVIFVADRGMFSHKNLIELQNSGCKFIVACPLKKQTKEIKNKILSESNYRASKLSSGANEEFCWIADIAHTFPAVIFEDKETDDRTNKEKIDNKSADNAKKQKAKVVNIPGRLIVSYSSKRARKDSSDRERMIEKTVKKFRLQLDKGKATLSQIISNRGYSKFVKVADSKSQTIELDNKKIEDESAWDGMHGVFTNTELSPEKVLGRYRGLWQIEECFRLTKSNIKIRPVFHFTPKRIKGHIALCFMALVTLKSLSKRLADKGIKLSSSKLVEESKAVQSSILREKGKKRRFKLPSRLSDVMKSVYKTLGISRKSSVELLK